MKKKPNLCVLLAKLSRGMKPFATSAKAKVGILLFVINFPFGYGGLALFTAMSAAYHDKRWLIGGTCCYVMSWIMLGLSILFLGNDTVKFLKKSGRTKWRAWRKARQIAP